MRSYIDIIVQFMFFSPPVDKGKICSAPIMNAEKYHAIASFCAGQNEEGAHLTIL